MKTVVIGGTGLIGSKLVTLLRQRGQEALAASPDTGVNVLTAAGLSEALAGAQVVVDVANSPSFEDAVVMNFFQTAGRNLLAADENMVRVRAAMIQPIASDDVASVLAEIALGPPANERATAKPGQMPNSRQLLAGSIRFGGGSGDERGARPTCGCATNLAYDVATPRRAPPPSSERPSGHARCTRRQEWTRSARN